MNPVDLHFQWAQPMAADIAGAMATVTISALSLHPPRHATGSNICKLWDALKAAIDNGAALDFFLPAPAKTHPATAMNGHAAERLHALGARVHFVQVQNLLHAKTVAIDNRLAWVGSGNWTAAATAHNHEAYCRIDSPAIAQRLAAHWHDLKRNGAP